MKRCHCGEDCCSSQAAVTGQAADSRFARFQNEELSIDAKRCFFCGAKDHWSGVCPVKGKGMKCFECREFGHIAARCPKKAAVVKDTCNVSRSARSKYYKDVGLDDKTISALIDTGSDLTLMRAD